MSEVSTNAPSSANEGHRERLRQRFLAGEATSLSDEALLELLLSYAIVRRDVQPLAKTLLARFGALDAVLAADPAALRKVSGIKDASVSLLKLVQHFRRKTSTAAPSEPQPTITAPTEIAHIIEPGNPPVEVVAEDSAKKRVVGERKLRVSGGYLLDTPPLAQLLSIMDSSAEKNKISRAVLGEGTGLPDRQIENLVSIGSALGLITPRTQFLSPFGHLVAKKDLFLDSAVTLEFCHFLAAGQQRNLVWFEVFNYLLATQPPMTQPAWSAWLREKFAGQYSESSLLKHVAHEVRFIIDAYTVRNFKKLGLLTESPEKTYALRRYSALQPLTLAAMIYAVGERNSARLVPFGDLHTQPGSPGRLFALDSNTLRQTVETLHQREWLRFEVRHGLDQLRLIEGFEPLEFLAAAYENRAPQLRATPAEPHAAPLLL